MTGYRPVEMVDVAGARCNKEKENLERMCG